MNYETELIKIFDSLEEEMEEIRCFPIEGFSLTYEPLLRSSISKTFDYCRSALKVEENEAFIYIPFLRGICEEYITLKFLSKSLTSDEKDTIVQKFTLYLQYLSLSAQKNFLDKVSNQPFLEVNDIDEKISELEENIKKFWKDQGMNKDKIFPGVKHMAIDSKTLNLYEFLYHASSKFVHFSPNLLFRLGWFLRDEGIIKFKISNFKEYYSMFIKFYGPFLFLKKVEFLKKELPFSTSFMKKIKLLKKLLEELDYPELVTYEEFNIKRPQPLEDSMIRVLKGLKKKK